MKYLSVLVRNLSPDTIENSCIMFLSFLMKILESESRLNIFLSSKLLERSAGYDQGTVGYSGNCFFFL